MKNIFKVIILLMIVFMILGGCSTPQESQSTGSNNSESTDGIPFDIGDVNADLTTITLDGGGTSPDYLKGYDGGFFYNYWKDMQFGNVGSSIMYIWDSGFYTFWNGVHGTVTGKGWATGRTNLVLTFHGWSYSTADQNGVDDDHYFGVYGWADNNWSSGHPDRLIEYYVVEMHGTKDHGLDNDGDQGEFGTYYGSDGSWYYTAKTRRVNKPSIRGYTDFDQYWSVRLNQRQQGTMTFAYHVRGWKNSGWTELTNSMMDDSELTYQILFVEAPYDANTGTGNGFGYIDSHNR